jgi:hypothetical protein
MFVCVWEQREPLLISETVTNYFFPLVCRQNDEKQCFFQSWTNLNGQIWPSITNSSQLFFEKFFLHMTHMHGFYLSPIFYEKWNPTSQSKSPNTYNFENRSKLKTSNFEQWQFFISQPNVIFKKPKDPAWNTLQLHQVRFSKLQCFTWLWDKFVRAGPF